MGHTNRFCPVVGATIPIDQRTRHDPCPFCGTPLPEDYERVDVTDEARAQGAAWLAADRNAGIESMPPPGEPAVPDVEPTQPPPPEFSPRDLLANPGDPTGDPAPRPDPLGPMPAQRKAVPWRLLLLGVGIGFFVLRGLWFSAPPHLSELDRGQCYNDPTDYVSVNTEVGEIEVLDCDEPHFYEFLGTYNSTVFATSSTYPSEAAVAEEAFDRCGAMFESHTGIPYGQAFLDVTWYTPLPGEWQLSKQTDVLCAIYTIEEVSESVHDRGGDYLLGCWTWEDRQVPCSGQHAYEQVAFAWHPAWDADPYPGDDAIWDWADDVCAAQYRSFTGLTQGENGFEWWWIAPDEATWTDGDRLLGCFASRLDDSEFSGTLYAG